MDQPPYVIRGEPSRGSIGIVSQGFWTVQTLEAFVAEMDLAIADCRARTACLSIKVNALAVQPQSAEVNTRMVGVWRSWLDRPGDRAAIIVKTALTTMQFRRLFENEQCRLFDHEAAADAWLAEPR